MQPYFFPYINYFELMSSVDTFVFFDDVQYIRRGWVNRNRIRRSDGGTQYITVPTTKAARSEKINNISIANNEWVNQHTKTFLTLYGKKAESHYLFNLYRSLSNYSSLSDMLCHTLASTASYLGIQVQFLKSSQLPSDSTRTDRLIEICKTLGASTYINAAGGRDLYKEEDFMAHSIELKFVEPTSHHNKLSIIDYCIGDGLTQL